ncbi:MAG: hypothetical protein M1381_08850 [Deltaproteobacteria bacterium]|nr:hypothetical protein [Deltaproteobacteria bacterium]MCL5792594.1 hypothetical protein [Deltaproteobacteria bacterium]
MIKRLVFILLIFMAGCINVNESVVLRLNGSGSMHVAYSIPEALIKDPQLLRNAMAQTGIVFPLTADELKKEFAGLRGVTVNSTKTSIKKGYYVVGGSVKFKNINNLATNNIKFVNHELNGNKELVIDLINTMNRSQESKSPEPMMIYRGSLTNFRIMIDVSFPTNVISSNGKINNRDVTWDVPMNVFLKSKAMTMELKAVYSGHPTIFDRIRNFFR